MKACFQHIHPVIEICFVAKTGKSLNKKAIGDCKKLVKREQYDENMFSIILPSVKFLAVGKLRTSCLIKNAMPNRPDG